MKPANIGMNPSAGADGLAGLRSRVAPAAGYAERWADL